MNVHSLIEGAVNGLLLGGLYTCAALGLSLVFGVLRFINVAHGELLVLAAYLVYVLTGSLGLHPLLAMLLALPVLFGVGYVLQRTLINPLMGKGPETTLLTAFGLSIIVQNLLTTTVGGNSRSLQTGLAESSVTLAGLNLPSLYLISFVVGVGLTSGLHYMLVSTPIGRAVRAAAQDAPTARVLGINTRQVYALTAGLSAVTAAVAGTLIGMAFSFTPVTGFTWLLKGLVVVVLGGMGSVTGTLAGGLLLGLSEGIGAALFGTGYRDLIGYLIFLLVLILRPNGLFGRAGSE